ncbi:MAG: hypothetical protein ACRD3C_17570 [Vicinamibacterales bacterium]
MRTVHLVGAVGIAAFIWTASPVLGQGPQEGGSRGSAASPKPLERLPDGQPNVQGMWGPINPGSLSLTNPVPQSADFDKTIKPLPSRVIDPPDGLVPYQPWAAALQKQQARDYAVPSRPEHIDTQHRCLLSGVPRLFTIVPALKIVQSPGQIVFIWDSYHAYRVIPLDGRPHVASNVKLWMGDGRGRWEGNTLIIDTTSVKGQRLTYIGDFYSENAHIAERIAWADADNLTYEATITDPAVFTRPWTMRVAQRRRPSEEMWETACYEGMANPDQFLLKAPGRQ